MKDKAGIELRPGQWIIYGHALGRCAGLQYGVVLSVKPAKGYYHKGKDCITVQGVDSDWEGHKPRLLKKGTLFFSERILAVFSIQVPDEVRQLLGTVKITLP